LPKCSSPSRAIAALDNRSPATHSPRYVWSTTQFVLSLRPLRLCDVHHSAGRRVLCCYWRCSAEACRDRADASSSKSRRLRRSPFTNHNAPKVTIGRLSLRTKSAQVGSDGPAAEHGVRFAPV
jgi:hypothetical protein